MGKPYLSIKKFYLPAEKGNKVLFWTYAVNIGIVLKACLIFPCDNINEFMSVMKATFSNISLKKRKEITAWVLKMIPVLRLHEKPIELLKMVSNSEQQNSQFEKVQNV